MATNKIEAVGQAGVGFFEYLGAMIESMTNEITTTANHSGVIKSLALLIGVSITLEIIITGFKVYAGKTETPTKDLIWSISLKLILVSIALDHAGYLTAIKDAINELQGLMSGKESMFVVMDEKTTQTIALTKAIGEAKTAWYDLTSGPSKLVSIILVWAGYLLGIFSSFLLLVTTKLTLSILLLVAPLVIFLKAYSFGKDIFDQWLGAILTNFITIFILGSAFNMFSRKYGVFIEATTKEVHSGDIILIGVSALLMGIILMMFIKVATNVAEQIGKVSLEGIGNGIGKAAQTVAGGAAAGAVGGAASSIGKAGMAMSAAAGAVGGAASSIGKAGMAMSAATGPAGIAMAGLKGLGGATGSAALGAIKGGLKSSFGKK